MEQEKERQIVSDYSSRFRKDVPLDSVQQGNAYGTVVLRERVRAGFDIWTTLPIICGHGGSMWLCQCCAAHLLIGGLGECPDPRHREQIKNFLRPSMRMVNGEPTAVFTATFNGMSQNPEAMKQALKELAQE